MITLTNIIAQMTGAGRLVPSGHLGSARHVHTTLRNPFPLLEMVKSVIPTMSCASHKGESGRIAVVGGSQEYTGAPYFAAISSLKLGADLSHVFCTQEASTVIKSYSPELIVHPILDHPSAVREMADWLPRMHSVVVGPGLGRKKNVLDNTRGIIEVAKEKNLPLVIDADGLFLVTEQPDVVKNYQRAILTPNIVEFTRLYEKLFGEKPNEAEPVVSVTMLAEALGNVTIVQKGENDIISDGVKVLVCCGEGSVRRCGGQGDLLSGTMGTFTYWAHKALDEKVENESLTVYGPTLCAAYAACLLTRHCNKLAFEKYRRSTTTSDMIATIQQAFEHLYM